ncbi:ribonuclease E/G [Arthrobacter sp. H41]|uniref:ribonuclease E/G n=1 Tax=Arthrobacter sp. H41 TaxID=1312978 RepID=UPI0006764DFE|nr:ribonuclease E/G [Arthrobacter sp. H41]
MNPIDQQPSEQNFAENSSEQNSEQRPGRNQEQNSSEPATADAQGAGTPAPAKRAPRVRRKATSPAGAPPAVLRPAPLEPTPLEPTAMGDSGTSGTESTGTAADGPAVGDTPPAAPRKRVSRSRKPAVEVEPAGEPAADPGAPIVDLLASSQPAVSDEDPTVASADAPVDAPVDTSRAVADAAPKAKAPRTRRRAATAEAGPAAPIDVAEPDNSPGTPADATPPASSNVDPAGAGVGSVDAGNSGAADGGSGRGAADVEVAAEKSTRTRRASRSRRAAVGETSVEASTVEASAKDVPAPAAAPPEEAAPADAVPEDAAATGDTPETEPARASHANPFALPESPLSLLFHAPDLAAAVQPVKVTAPPAGDPGEDDIDDSGSDNDNNDDGSGRRPRRSRRSRGRGRADSSDASSSDRNDVEGSESRDSDSGPGDESPNGVTSRRRRRRRRGEQDLELTGGEDDDPPNTVTRVRAPRQSSEPVSDKVTSVKGSTRLEAKKQRRRESRDTGRRRQVITEAEFLARRESVDRQMVVRQRDDRIQIGVLEDGILAEHFVSKTQQDSLIGNVYVGKVQNVLPSMEAAFVDIGRGRNAVLYAGEVNWDAAGLDGQPRRIELALKSGDAVLVQVTKDPVGHKGARLTSQISLPGRYLVYVPGGSMTGISRKLPDVERNRLKRILKDRLPENAGVIVRTAAEGASEEELTHDINRLRSQWEQIESASASTKTLAPELLYGEPDLTIKVVRDVFNEDFSKLVVSGEEAWDTIEAYVMYVAPDLVGRLEKWTGDEDIFAASRIDEQISKALDRKVFLPSGGSLVIDRTEAMTVVDVNTGKFTGSGGNLEETVTKNNLEAAEEVVRQLRLRDIGGIIVIDFIDMVLEANRDLVLRRLVECLGRDRTKHQVAEVTSLGLVQMTRKRMGTGLLEVFGEDCEHCGGRGVVTHEEPVEHRRSGLPQENQQQQSRQEKQPRNERKRTRGRSAQQVEETQPAPTPQPDSPERAAKAEAARTAFASIAAATHASHAAHEEHAAGPAPEPAVQVNEAVLTINGETVTLPRAEAHRTGTEGEQPRLTLDSLTAAFNRAPAASSETVEAAASPNDGAPSSTGGSDTGRAPANEAAPTETPSSDGPGTGVVAPAPRRRRARRAASSAQGSAAGSAIETLAAESGTAPDNGSAAAGRHVARAEAPANRPAASGAEPVIFGVGVPASEL